jgi:putative spermidine/putrescine transport system ATP-binding protein
MVHVVQSVDAAHAHVSLSGISRAYGSNLVVDNVNFEVQSGKILALLGPSGCGKTTTLRMIAGLVQPTSGKIIIDGQLMNDLPVHKRNLGMLFQHYALFPHMSVLENVVFGLTMRGFSKSEAEERAHQALALTHLSDFSSRMPAQLSGGQQQRVALARAIVYRPKVLLLDEPFAALDKKLREMELQQLCAELSLTTIIVTHDQEEALVLADQIAVIRAGRIEQIGSAREIYEQPKSHFVADFIGSSNFLPVEILANDNGCLRLKTSNGTLLGSSFNTSNIKGPSAIMAVRPENITLTRERQGGDDRNSLRGAITRQVFKGQSTSVWIDADGIELEAWVSLNDDGSSIPQVGEIWTASWTKSRSMLVGAM